MIRTRIKFCGITRVRDALHAADLGVDAIGLVCTRRSPRFVAPEQARAIASALPPMLGVVALFMDDTAGWVREIEDALRPALLQFHGAEDDGFCAGFATPFLKAVAMNSIDDVAVGLAAFPRACGFVLDGHVNGGQGGTGTSFDWSRMPPVVPRPVVLAGGLDAANVATAIRHVQPWAVDVSSGIETSPGIKSPEKMQAFVKAVQSVQAS